MPVIKQANMRKKKKEKKTLPHIVLAGELEGVCAPPSNQIEQIF